MARLIKSFRYAIRGIFIVIRGENNARIHMIAATIVLLTGWWLELSVIELAILVLAIAMVILMEAANTVAEKILDIVDNSHNPRVAKAKDMAAGAVLLAALLAAIIGALMFVPHLEKIWGR